MSDARTAFDLEWTCFEVTLDAGVAHIRMKREEAMNSMNRAFWNELPAIVRDIDDNARARCIVISSTGKHFCAGMDLQEAIPRLNAGEDLGYSDHTKRPFSDVFKPIIAAVNGFCIAGGMEFMQGTDIRIAR